MPQATMQTPVLIAGRYALEEAIGEGGMAVVWRATDRTLQRTVAVKLLEASGRDRDAVAERFLREARLAAAVEHRHVVRVVDFGRTEDGTPFMVMEFLQGESFADYLYKNPRPPVEDVVRIVALALRGLEVVHEAGIVHRDIKPDNIFLANDVDGICPKLLDFGISRVHKPSSGHRSAYTTHEGLLIGTPQYMSPEQARGLRDVDSRADIYSMGVILYEALTGTLPYVSENPGDLLVAVIHGGCASVEMLRPEVSQTLSGVVACAMSTERPDRYADARAMRRALLDAVPAANRAGEHTALLSLDSPSGIRTRPRSGFPTAQPTVESAAAPMKKSPVVVGTMVVGAVIAVALGAWLASRSPETPPTQAPTVTLEARPTEPVAADRTPPEPVAAPAETEAETTPASPEESAIPTDVVAPPAPAREASAPTNRTRRARRPRPSRGSDEGAPAGSGVPAAFRRLDY